MPERNELLQLDKETLVDLLEDAAKNWLAHDGLWFQAIEKAYGMAAAIEMDRRAWMPFTQIEARRIMQRQGIAVGGGLQALAEALKYRQYARLNEQSMLWVDERTLRFEMNDCRVQSARERKGLAAFPCKTVGVVEYAYFAHTIDPRIRTAVVVCPPDPHPEHLYCSWQFTLEEQPIPADQLLPDEYKL